MNVDRKHLAGLKLALSALKGDMHRYECFGDVLGVVEGLIAQASAAPEQKPAMWDWVIGEGGVEYKPLYTHADPSEVAQLRAEIEELRVETAGMIGDIAEIEVARDAANQRAVEAERKLGEAMGLLREIAEHIKGSGFGNRALALLSGNAEPSAAQLSALQDEQRLGIERLPAAPAKGGYGEAGHA